MTRGADHGKVVFIQGLCVGITLFVCKFEPLIYCEFVFAAQSRPQICSKLAQINSLKKHYNKRTPKREFLKNL